jgi:large subunit ribosomal protein L29
MATETLKEFRGLNDKELQKREQELREELYKARTGEVTEKVKDTSKAGKIKKDIARIKTLLRENETKNSKAQKA